MKRNLVGSCSLVAPLWGAVSARAQAPDPADSTRVFNLTTFTTLPGLQRNSGAIDLEHPKDGSGRIFVSTNEGKVHSYGAGGDYLGVFLDPLGHG